MNDALWTPRIEDRFAQIDKDLSRIEHDLRVLWPVPGQVATVEADVVALEANVRELRVDLKELRAESATAVRLAEGVARAAEAKANESMTEILRSSRSDFVKLVIAFVGFFGVVGSALIAAIAKGVI